MLTADENDGRCHMEIFIYMDVAPVDELSRLWSTQHGKYFILKMLTKFWPVVAL